MGQHCPKNQSLLFFIDQMEMLFFADTSGSPDSALRPSGCIVILLILFLFQGVAGAKERQSDPDGCLVCHALEGLQYVDKKGVLRVATIDKADYFGSLHGSVPCTDCHAMKTYPHEVKDGLVDCSTECHVNEPSNEERFTHKAVVKEFLKSTHGNGRVKDFEGGNRLAEDGEPDPSCRRCHSNTPYIVPSQMAAFKAEMKHTDAECGKCHVGEVWMNQFGGHILRRLVGSRWNKNDINKSCIQCHGDVARMEKVKIEDPSKRQVNNSPLVAGQGIADGRSPKDSRTMPVTYRWKHSVESYERTLHSRMLVVGEEKSPSCLDCHIHHGKGFNGHGILKDEDPTASTHPDQLGKTCGASGCHQYAKEGMNQGFVKTDVHAISQVQLPSFMHFIHPKNIGNFWHGSALGLMLMVAAFVLGSLYWVIVVYPKSNKSPSPVIGDKHFEEVMLGRKPKKAPPKAPVAAAKTPSIATVTPKPAVETMGEAEPNAALAKPASTSESAAGPDTNNPAKKPAAIPAVEKTEPPTSESTAPLADKTDKVSAAIVTPTLSGMQKPVKPHQEGEHD